MITKLPADRPLPHRQEILERVLADSHAPARQRPGWLVPVSAAASIALVAGGVLIATNGNDKSQPGPAASTAPSVPSTTPSARRSISIQPDVHINLGPLTATERTTAAKNCVDEMENHNTATEIGHGLKVMSWGGGKPSTTIAFTADPEGLRFGCEGTGKQMTQALVGGDPAVAARNKNVITHPDATHPAAPAEGQAWFCFVDLDTKPDVLAGEGWYSVDERVASMRQRWVVRGRPGPWYVAEPADGLVFLRSWDKSAALKLGEEVRVETQVLDHSGGLLDAPGSIKGGGGLTPSPGTTRVDRGKVIRLNASGPAELDFR
ncbi:hypothetical protein [Kribbella sp. NPDC049227]|uniref:hypothetical protein n=1 Tax=Kribbella sp. NPDC049227 TaxID=3364113 RepID=UPI003722FA0A